LTEYYRVRDEEEVENSVDEGSVEGDEEDDWFGEKECQRAREVLGDECFEVDCDFFLFGMDTPAVDCC